MAIKCITFDKTQNPIGTQGLVIVVFTSANSLYGLCGVKRLITKPRVLMGF